MFIPFTGFVLMVIVLNVESERCSDYGCPLAPPIIYEPFLPAARGHTPHCAQPGQTFCEVLDHYPQQLINFLVEKCTFDFKTILKDETPHEFNSYRKYPDYNQGYEYRKPAVPESFSQNLPFFKTTPFRRPELIYGSPFNSTYEKRFSQPGLSKNSFNFSPPSPTMHQQFRQKSDFSNTKNYQFSGPPNLDQTLWLNRFTRENDVGKSSRRKNPLLEYANKKADRPKRQNNNVVSICPTRTKFIYPRAALNKEGNWMYVVNTEEIDKNNSQTVKSEVCETDTCNELCSLPIGYTSRCTQQYVQKRLVALEGSGNRLYTDIFWFPHGCMCQVMLEF